MKKNNDYEYLPDDDPLVEAFEPLPRGVSFDIIRASRNARKVIDPAEAVYSDGTIISVSCSAYISGVMRVLTQLYLDSGETDLEKAEDAALLFLTTAATMYTKRGRTEH